MYTLTTLYRLRSHLGFAADDTAEDARLLAALEAASTSIEHRARRRFSPHLESLPHSINPVSSNELLLRDDLLHLSAVEDAAGAIALSRVMVLTGGVLRLIDGTAFRFVDTPQDAVLVRAYWGYHPDWDAAFVTSGDGVQDAALSAGAASITVADVTGTGLEPRFQVGQLLRIGEEYVRVLAVDAVNNQLRVARGVQGTTATPHSNGSSIAVYQPAPDVEIAVLQWAAWLYQSPDAGRQAQPMAPGSLLDGLRRIRVT